MPHDAFPPCPSPFNLAEYVLNKADCHRDKIALEIIGAERPQQWSYGALSDAVRGVATGLQRAGLAQGDVVLLRIGNTADFPIAYLGVIAAGMIAVPTSAALTEHEITKMSAQIAPKAIIQAPDVTAPHEPDALRISVQNMRAMQSLPPADFQRGDPERAAYIVFTSGTSGSPRAVLHAHRAIWARRMMHRGWYDMRSSDRLLHAGAFNWTFTLGTGLMDPWTLGATALIPAPKIAAEELAQLLADHKATLFAAAPGVFRKMLRAPMPPLPHLRHALSAGEKMPASLHDAWHKATGLKVYEAFGMSECSTFISSNPARPADAQALGYAQNGRTIALLAEDGTPVSSGEIGTIAVHRNDPGLMLEYLGAPQETTARMQGAWFLTGDQAHMDARGQVFYHGRQDDMLNAGGFRVSPLEIENALHRENSAGQIAAVEFTIKQGTSIIALCFTDPEPDSEEALKALASERLADYKQPRLYHFCDALPHSANGKLLRGALRDMLEATYGQA